MIARPGLLPHQRQPQCRQCSRCSHRLVHRLMLRARDCPGARHTALAPHRMAVGAAASGDQQATSSSASISELKAAMLETLNAVEERGLFGTSREKRDKVFEAIAALEDAVGSEMEARQVLKNELDALQGRWRLLFSTVTIQGVRKTRLGLRSGIVHIGDLFQDIDVDTRTASNIVEFRVAGFGKESTGSFTLKSAWQEDPDHPNRVIVSLESAKLVPESVERLFQENYDLLLEIFNPEGWLDTTFLDSHIRVGRDNKDKVFILEKV